MVGVGFESQYLKLSGSFEGKIEDTIGGSCKGCNMAVGTGNWIGDLTED